MSGLLAFESDTAEREREMRELMAAGGLEPCYVEKRDGAPYKVHAYVREPRVLEPDEDVAFYFDTGGLTAKTTAQLRCCLGPESAYQTTLERWDAPRATAEGYARVVELAGQIEATQARLLRNAEGSAANAASRHTALFRLGCLLFRFGTDTDAVEAAAWRWQEAKFGPDAISDRREFRRQLKGSRRKVELADGEVGVELHRRNETRFAFSEMRRHLSACLYSTWTDDPDLIAEMVEEVGLGR